MDDKKLTEIIDKDEQKRIELNAFLRAIFFRWKGWVSGSAFGIALAFLGYYQISIPSYIIFIFITAGVFYSIYCVWRDERNLRIAAEKKLKPKLEIFYNENDEKCFQQNTLVTKEGTVIKTLNQTVFRLAVKSKGPFIVEGCKGILTQIHFEGEEKPIFGRDNYNLAFAPNSDDYTDNKSISDHSEALDLLFIYFESGSRLGFQMGTKLHTWPDHFTPPHIMFKRNGIYIWTIRLVSNEAPAQSIRIKFSLSDIYGESRARLLIGED